MIEKPVPKIIHCRHGEHRLEVDGQRSRCFNYDERGMEAMKGKVWVWQTKYWGREAVWSIHESIAHETVDESTEKQ